MKRVAIITARGGSKRIPRKNVRPFLGKPIILYSIETALASGLFDEVMVSTDDSEIAGVARSGGASVPFARSAETAGDHASTIAVILEVLAAYRERGQVFDQGCCIYPTAPFITAEILRKGFEELTNGRRDVVFPVAEFSYSIFRSLRRSPDGRVEMFFPENLEKRSQDLPPAFHDAGQFYCFDSAAVIEKKRLFTDNTGGLVLDDLRVQDIDNERDWQMAEWKYQTLRRLEAGEAT